MDYTPERALVVIPHPDDAEVWAGGTIARWVRAGSEVHYVLCTDGSKGTDDPEIDPKELGSIRRREQLAAAAILGVKNVVMLGRPDGELEDTSDFRRDLVRQIRVVKPDVVLTTEPYRRNMQWHRDHRIAGQVTLDAVFPYARDHLHFGELFANEGIEPHKTAAIMFWGSENPNSFVDIAADFDTKMDAVMAHGTQARQRPREDLEGFVRERPMRQRAVQAEVLAQLTGEQRVHLVDVYPPRQEVGLPAPQFAGAGPRQEKTEAPRVLIQEELHHVEKGRDPLYLVQEHRAHIGRSGHEFAFEPFRMGDEIPKHPGTGKVQRDVRCGGRQQGGLADLPWPEHEDAAPIGFEDVSQNS